MTKKTIHRLTAICTLLLCMACMTSCRDKFDINQLETSSKLVAYAFPSIADTTYMQLWQSIPVGKNASEVSQDVAGAVIQYRVNGTSRSAVPMGDGAFYTVGTQQPGDTVELEVATNDLPTVSAKAVIPHSIPVNGDTVIFVTRIGEDDVKDTYYQIQAHFSDPAPSSDYYAVRVLCKDVAASSSSDKDDVRLDSALFWAEVNTKDEPLLQHISDLDNSFGFNNLFFRNFYIFDDRTVNGITHTLRLNVLSYQSALLAGTVIRRSFKVCLYKLEPAYYKFLKSLNELLNNSLARHGLAQIRPTFTNITGGIGVLGCYSMSESEWQTVVPN